jgi:chromosome segregation ATPase
MTTEEMEKCIAAIAECSGFSIHEVRADIDDGAYHASRSLWYIAYHSRDAELAEKDAEIATSKQLFIDTVVQYEAAITKKDAEITRLHLQSADLDAELTDAKAAIKELKRQRDSHAGMNLKDRKKLTETYAEIERLGASLAGTKVVAQERLHIIGRRDAEIERLKKRVEELIDGK